MATQTLNIQPQKGNKVPVHEPGASDLGQHATAMRRLPKGKRGAKHKTEAQRKQKFKPKKKTGQRGASRTVIGHAK